MEEGLGVSVDDLFSVASVGEHPKKVRDCRGVKRWKG
jgi:hypothetical protein